MGILGSNVGALLCCCIACIVTSVVDVVGQPVVDEGDKPWENGVEYIGNAQFFPQRSFGPEGLRDAFEGPPRKMEWLKIAFNTNAISGLTIEKPDWEDFATRADFQGFNDIYFEEGTPMPTCRVDPLEQRIFCLSSSYVRERDDDEAPRQGYCCGDHFTIYYRDGRVPSRLYFIDEVRAALNGTTYPTSVDMSPAEATSITFGSEFTLEYDQGLNSNEKLLTMYLTLEYTNDILLSHGWSSSDFAQVLLRFEETDDLEITKSIVVPHQSGNTTGVLGLRDLGTVSTKWKDQLHQIHYSKTVLEGPMARITGLVRFTDPATDINMVSFCLKANSECVITRDRWRGDRGTVAGIIQRFGTPPVRDPDTGKHLGYLYFGMDPATYDMPATGLTGGVHGAWLTVYTAGGQATVTYMFNMEDSATMSSYGAEAKTFNSRIIEVGVTPFLDSGESEGPPRSPDGILFSTTFRETIMDMHIQTGGGARPLSCGLYVVSSGYSDLSINPFVGIAVVDPNGDTLKYSTNSTGTSGAPSFDPFIFFQPRNDPYITWGDPENLTS